MLPNLSTRADQLDLIAARMLAAAAKMRESAFKIYRCADTLKGKQNGN